MYCRKIIVFEECLWKRKPKATPLLLRIWISVFGDIMLCGNIVHNYSFLKWCLQLFSGIQLQYLHSCNKGIVNNHPWSTDSLSLFYVGHQFIVERNHSGTLVRFPAIDTDYTFLHDRYTRSLSRDWFKCLLLFCFADGLLAISTMSVQNSLQI